MNIEPDHVLIFAIYTDMHELKACKQKTDTHKKPMLKERATMVAVYLAAKFYFGKQFDCHKMLINIIIIVIMMRMDDDGDDNAHTTGWCWLIL